MSERGWSDLTLGEKIIGLTCVLPMVLVGIALIITGEGYCTQLMWNWYAEPIVHHSINLPHAVGLNLLAGIFIFQWPTKDHELDTRFRTLVSTATGYFLVTLVGYFLHSHI